MEPHLRFVEDLPVATDVATAAALPFADAALRQARRVMLRADERLCHVGQHGRCVHFIGGGAFKLMRPCADGEDFMLGFRFRGEWVGLEALTGAAYRYEAVALCDAWVYSIDAAGLGRDAADGSSFQRILGAFAGELDHARERCFLLSRPSACERVAILLMELSRRLCDADARVPVIDLPMSREDIACYLSITRETVSRTLANLQHRGLIAVSRRRITLLQPAALARMAHGSPDEMRRGAA